MAKQTQNAAKNKQKKGISFLAKAYLFVYNAVQVVGWSYLLYQIITYYTSPSADSKNLYDTVKLTVIVFQNAAVLEIFHAAAGIVPSSVMITLMQVFSRVMVVCGVLMATPTAQNSPGLPICLIAWCVTEIIRYAYYAFHLVNLLPYFLTWLRYTLFYILYPMGVTGELWCFYSAQSYVYETKMWTVTLPNVYNFTFNYHYLLVGIMLSYIPLFPQMYFHMIGQRKKIIGGGDKGKKAKAH